MIDSPTVPPGALNEEIEEVIVHRFDGKLTTIARADLLVIDLGNLAIAWKATDGKIHRSIGVPLEVIAVESRIVKPV